MEGRGQCDSLHPQVQPLFTVRRQSAGLFLVAGAVWSGAFFVFFGWALSAVDQLGRFGYLGMTIAVGLGLFYFWKNCSWLLFFRKCAARLRRVGPAFFAAAACFSLLGALLHVPSNYDALSYRIPRVMHWLAQEGWFWISTANPRQNYSGTGQEWLLAPLVVMTGTDRLLFLPNWICFLLLPSVFFRLLRSVGLDARSAVFWMWLLPFAPAYLLQSGGISNDLLGAFWFFASLALLPGRGTLGSMGGSSMLSIALATGVKATNLVLLLPYAIRVILCPFLKSGFPKSIFFTFPLALIVSFAPVAALNLHYAGDWAGDPGNDGKMKSSDFWTVASGNGLLVAADNLNQPFNLGTNKLIQIVLHALPDSFLQNLALSYPRWTLFNGEFAIEESAALGWPLVVLAIAGFLFSRRIGSGPSWLLAVAGWVSALVLMGKLASEAVPRLLSPLYPVVLLPLFSLPKKGALFFTRAGLLFALFIFPTLFLSPSRPLIPWTSVGRWLDGAAGNHSASTRIARITASYEKRATGLRLLIPEELFNRYLKILMISNGNDTEGPLWWPYGKRWVQSALASQPVPDFQPDLIIIREIEWADWSRKNNITGEVKSRLSVSLMAQSGPEIWLAIRPLK